MEEFLATAERGVEALKRVATACEKLAQCAATYGVPSMQEIASRKAQQCWDQVPIREEGIEKLVKRHKSRVQDMLQETQALWLRDGLASEEKVVKKIQELERFQLEEREKFLQLEKKSADCEADFTNYAELLAEGIKAARL